jgi:hypothetical protein
MNDNFDIWNVISYSWTEIGLEEHEYAKYAEKIIANHQTWEEVNSIIIKDVCASFAFDTFLAFPCMLWFIMPDWAYEDDYLRARMKKWYAKPYWTHFINPLRILGFPLALIFSSGVRNRLKREYKKISVK